MSYSGMCLCGQCSIHISSTVTSLLTCHCTDCQQSSGTSCCSVIESPKGDVYFEGPVKEFSYRSDLGKLNKRLFCGECGSSLAQSSDEWDIEVAVHVGNVPDCKALPCEREIYTRSKFTSLPKVSGAQEYWADVPVKSSNQVNTESSMMTGPTSTDQPAPQISGECVCGQCTITVKMSQPPPSLIVCHCGDCQHFTGSTNSIYAIFSRNDVTITGSTRIFERLAEKSTCFVFCDSCGSSISRWNKTEVEPGPEDKIAVFSGSFPALRDRPVTLERDIKNRFTFLAPIQDAIQREQ